jgi:hypothetical protein
LPSRGKPLPYPIVIADRRNNRLLDVAPDKCIVFYPDGFDLDVFRDWRAVSARQDEAPAAGFAGFPPHGA